MTDYGCYDNGCQFNMREKKEIKRKRKMERIDDKCIIARG